MENKKVVGFNVYKNDKNQNIYYNHLTKKGYLIDDKNIEKFNLFNKRHFIAIAIGMIIPYYFVNTRKIEIMIIVSIIFLCISQFLFYKKFLPTLTQFENFKPLNKTSFLTQIKEGNSKGKLILKAFLFVLLGILLFLYSKEKKLVDFNLYICYIAAFLSICFGFLQLFLSLSKK